MAPFALNYSKNVDKEIICENILPLINIFIFDELYVCLDVISDDKLPLFQYINLFRKNSVNAERNSLKFYMALSEIQLYQSFVVSKESYLKNFT